MKILVTGGTGLVGKGLEKITNKYNNHQFIFLSSKDCDLTNYQSTYNLFDNIKPDYIIHLAANVGGLFKNMNFKVDMLEKNLLINYNVLRCSHEHKIKKVISCLSTCIFPDKTSYPINETMLHDGPPHCSNDSYAYAKRMLEIHSKAYQEQYNDNFICIIPTNIYGPYDNYHLEDAHVIPALIHKCYLAKKNKEPFIVRGTGKPLRQFIYSEDLAELIMWTLDNYDQKDSLILSVGEKDEVSIETVAREIARNFDYEDKLIFDPNFADGQFKKTADNTKLINLMCDFEFTSIKEGIQKSVEWFVENYSTVRK
jgi:GDP-L-fucose synthase